VKRSVKNRNWNLSAALVLPYAWSFLVFILLVSCSEQANTPLRAQQTFSAAVAGDLAGITERVSIHTDLSQANNNSISSDISADGRFIVFDSIANNLVPEDNNAVWDIFLRDRLTGTTTRLSQGMSAEANGNSYFPAISDNGRFVVFSSDANNLVPDDTNETADVFLFDLLQQQLTRISVSSTGVEADGKNTVPMISATGDFIVYQSVATNLIDGQSLSGIEQVYLYHRSSGETQLISASNGIPGNGSSTHASINAAGTLVVFDSASDNLLSGDSNGVEDIYMKNLQTGTLVRISDPVAGQANGGSTTPSLSADGSVVLFQSNATNLVDGDTNGFRDVFAYPIDTQQLERVSVSSSGAQAANYTLGRPDVSADGRYVVFYTAAALETGKNPLTWDIFLRDRINASTSLVSMNDQSIAGDFSSFEPAISAGGNYVVFGSEAENLVSDDNNGVWDIFLRIMIDANQLPVAAAGADRSVYVGETVQLDGSTSSDPDNTGPLQFQWTLDSVPTGSSAALLDASTATPTFLADVSGEYIISLNVSDGLDQSGDQVIITANENLPPNAVISANVISGSSPLTVVFSAQGSSDPEGSRLSYSWDFSDPANGSNSADQAQVSHTFTRPGTYTVSVAVTDALGNRDTASVTVQVEAAAFAPGADVTTGAAPLTVQFFANSPYPPRDSIHYLWDFGDGGTSTEMDPVHTYEFEGTYEARVTISDGRNSITGSITITVTSARQQITLQTGFLRVESDSGKIKWVAQFSLENPLAADSVVQVHVDGILIFSQPLASFQSVSETVYVYKDGSTRLQLDLNTGNLRLRRSNLDLGLFDPGNGVEITVDFGRQWGSELISVREISLCSPCREERKDDSDDHNDSSNSSTQYTEVQSFTGSKKSKSCACSNREHRHDKKKKGESDHDDSAHETDEEIDNKHRYENCERVWQYRLMRTHADDNEDSNRHDEDHDRDSDRDHKRSDSERALSEKDGGLG